MLIFKLAWRNIWRNRRRTIITTLSIVVAVFLSAITRSTQEGQYDNMLENTVGIFSGYIQIHQNGYQDNPTLDNSFAMSDTLRNIVISQPAVSSVVPRIDSYALAATSEQSRPVMIMGIDIDAEKQLSNPVKNLETGNYFDSNNEQAAIVGKDLLKRLNARIGDSLVVIGQGYHGMNATGLYHIKGTVSFPNPEMNKSLVYLPLETAQYLFSADNRLTSLALNISSPDELEPTVEALKQDLSGEHYEVLGWPELMPELKQAIQVDRGSGIIIILILYMIVGFGVLGTVLMMIAERYYEFGVMLSVGTPRKTIAKILSLEVIILSLMGTFLGILLSIPVAWYFNVNPIDLSGAMASAAEQYNMSPMLQFSVSPEIFTNQAITVFIITLIFSIYPIIKASRLNPVKAMKS
ncbi:ABC transporter permease [Balneolaceae bacterium YR4-1]|uniref:ABC transporter permease n=1 Tax=Halalkalibaculum roseum TaxID=2709311 RepID=A0A6M1SSG9_9BACT|nr:FtsX-like permease family protein [Halalkalibaculum roseum]NGP75702.1 ABC transporter permease [Halalkalibaculum roseum]